MTTHPQYPGHYPPPTPPPAPAPVKKGRVHWAWLILVFFVGIFFGSIGGGSSTPSETAASGPMRVVQTPAAVQPAPQAQETAQADAGPMTEWGDGTWIVGVDIQPGTYVSSGAKSGIIELCSASTKKGASSNSDNIDWLTANADERLVIEIISEAKAFVNNNCEPFTKID